MVQRGLSQDHSEHPDISMPLKFYPVLSQKSPEKQVAGQRELCSELVRSRPGASYCERNELCAGVPSYHGCVEGCIEGFFFFTLLD